MSTVDLRALRDKAAAPPPAPKLAARDVVAHVTYHEQRATVGITVPTGEQRAQIDRMAALLAAGPWAHLPPTAQARCVALATVTVAVSDLPKWAETAIQEDDALLFALYAEVDRHAARYFRRDGGPGVSGEGGSPVVVALAEP